MSSGGSTHFQTPFRRECSRSLHPTRSKEVVHHIPVQRAIFDIASARGATALISRHRRRQHSISSRKGVTVGPDLRARHRRGLTGISRGPCDAIRHLHIGVCGRSGRHRIFGLRRLIRLDVLIPRPLLRSPRSSGTRRSSQVGKVFHPASEWTRLGSTRLKIVQLECEISRMLLLSLKQDKFSAHLSFQTSSAIAYLIQLDDSSITGLGWVRCGTKRFE